MTGIVELLVSDENSGKSDHDENGNSSGKWWKQWYYW